MPDLVLRIKRIVALASPDRDVRQRDLYLYIPEKAPRLPCSVLHIRNVAHDVLRVDFPRRIGNSLEDSVGNRRLIAAGADLVNEIPFIGGLLEITRDILIDI